MGCLSTLKTRFSLASVMGPARVMELLFCQLWDRPADFVVAQVPAAPTPARWRSPGGPIAQLRSHPVGIAGTSSVRFQRAATSNPNRPPTAPPRPIRRHVLGDMRNVQQGPQCGDQRLGRPGPPPADLHQQKPGHVRLPKAPANRSATGLPALTSARRTQFCTVCAVSDAQLLGHRFDRRPVRPMLGSGCLPPFAPPDSSARPGTALKCLP